MRFTALRGFRDYLPPDAGARAEVRRRMAVAARRAGFGEVETPSIEALELFRVKSGEDIIRQLWGFRDKGGREVALLAETTPSLARMFVERSKAEPLPVKWFTFSKLWRYEEPQSGRTREFGQLNLDILGVPGITAEAELLAAAALCLDEAGATGLYMFRINDRELAEAVGRRVGVQDMEAYFRAVDGYRKMSPAEFQKALQGAGLPAEGVATISALLEETGEGVDAPRFESMRSRLEALNLPDPGPAALNRLRNLLDRVRGLGIADRVLFDPGLVRGIAYYTSTVFEGFDRAGQMRALLGGGRYDRLVELFGGSPTPAVGLAIGDQVLELLLRANGRWPKGEPDLDAYVVAVTEAEVPLAAEYVERLRRSGRSADVDLLGRTMSKQLKEAARRRARRAILVGPKERARGVVVERDLTTGAQRERSPDEALGPE